ncbi:hypothetical protein [Senegalia massiliensis]|nr:hypothetical protein [Senegalia massiliensis]
MESSIFNVFLVISGLIGLYIVSNAKNPITIKITIKSIEIEIDTKKSK